MHLILASGSAIRADLLRRAGIDFRIVTSRVDEDAIRKALVNEKATPRDVADCLAEMKARRVSVQNPGALVLGCDQVLEIDGCILSKPVSTQDCEGHLRLLRGKSHKLLSAAVIHLSGEPLWRHVGTARLQMHDLSDGFISDYVTRNWESIRNSVGGYKLEEEGVRLFTSVQGDFFHVLGMPLLEVLSYLTQRGELKI
jgi:septum formation protein